MKAKPKEEGIERRTDKIGRYEDLLEIARLVSWCLNRDFLIQTSLNHISKKLGKRAQCVFLEEEGLKLHCSEDRYGRPLDHAPIVKENIIRQVVEKGLPVNLTDANGTEEYRLAPEEEKKVTAVIPLWYVDSMTQEERRVGVLVVDSGQEPTQISTGDFEYLKVVGELIGSAIGKAELTEQAVESCLRKEAMLKETSHGFRNRIAAIGGFSQRIARLAKDTRLAREARMLYQEVLKLETQLGRFEKYMDG